MGDKFDGVKMIVASRSIWLLTGNLFLAPAKWVAKQWINLLKPKCLSLHTGPIFTYKTVQQKEK